MPDPAVGAFGIPHSSPVIPFGDDFHRKPSLPEHQFGLVLVGRSLAQIDSIALEGHKAWHWQPGAFARVAFLGKAVTAGGDGCNGDQQARQGSQDSFRRATGYCCQRVGSSCQFQPDFGAFTPENAWYRHPGLFPFVPWLRLGSPFVMREWRPQNMNRGFELHGGNMLQRIPVNLPVASRSKYRRDKV